MRVFIGLSAHQANIRAVSANFARRALKQNHIDQLLIEDRLVGDNDTGTTVLRWAAERGYLPRNVVLVDPEPSVIREMAAVLTKNGFTAIDGRNFIKPA